MNADDYRAEARKFQNMLDLALEREREANRQRQKALEELQACKRDNAAEHWRQEYEKERATLRGLKLVLDDASEDHRVHQRLRERIVQLADKWDYHQVTGVERIEELRALLEPEKETAREVFARIKLLVPADNEEAKRDVAKLESLLPQEQL